MSFFVVALRNSWPSTHDMYGEEMSMEDAESIVVALIDQGLVRGYISHNRQTLVFARKLMLPRPTV